MPRTINLTAYLCKRDLVSSMTRHVVFQGVYQELKHILLNPIEIMRHAAAFQVTSLLDLFL